MFLDGDDGPFQSTAIFSNTSYLVLELLPPGTFCVLPSFSEKITPLHFNMVRSILVMLSHEMQRAYLEVPHASSL